MEQFVREKQNATKARIGHGSSRDQSVTKNTLDLTSQVLDYIAKIKSELGIKNTG